MRPDTQAATVARAGLPGIAPALERRHSYLCIRHDRQQAGLIQDGRLATFEERHSYCLELPDWYPTDDFENEVAANKAAGVVFVMSSGIPSWSLLRLATALHARQRSVFFCWPDEAAVERIEAAQLARYRRLWLLAAAHQALKGPLALARRLVHYLRPAPAVHELTLAGDVMNQRDKLDKIETGDSYKEEVQKQWNSNPCGAHYARQAESHTLDWYLEVERYRYGEYAPWMPRVMEFADHAGKELLEVGGGLGTDLAQFARHGARVTDVDLSAGHLTLAQENFRLRGLSGQFIHHDAESLPFPDNSFDVVYSNGVIHHTPNTQQVIREVHRVLKPGGRAIIMVYAQGSLFFWGRMVYGKGMKNGLLSHMSVAEVLSRHVEITDGKARPLVKVYTKQQARALFRDFADVQICKRQLMRSELPGVLRWLPLGLAGRLMGFNLIIKATKGR